jgi:phospholipase/carboxylesterase
MRTTRMAGLTVRIAGGSDREGGGSGPVVVLMHGFGAPGEDLVSLQRVIDVPREVRFVFPEAPLAPPEFAGFGGRAWWQLDLARLQAAATGRKHDRTRETPAGLADARARVIELLDAVERELGVSGDRIVLGGFSQGAMLACDVALRSERALAGLVLMSSTLLCVDEWQPLMQRRKELPILQSHGTLDPLLDFNAAVALRDLLRGEGCSVEWVEFRGAHEIPMTVLQAIGGFVRKHAVVAPGASIL